MPKETKDSQAVTLWIKKDLVSKIDTIAKKGDVTRSRLITALVGIMVEEVVRMNKVGKWAMGRIYKEIEKKIKGE